MFFHLFSQLYCSHTFYSDLSQHIIKNNENVLDLTNTEYLNDLEKLIDSNTTKYSLTNNLYINNIELTLDDISKLKVTLKIFQNQNILLTKFFKYSDISGIDIKNIKNIINTLTNITNLNNLLNDLINTDHEISFNKYALLLNLLNTATTNYNTITSYCMNSILMNVSLSLSKIFRTIELIKAVTEKNKKYYFTLTVRNVTVDGFYLLFEKNSIFMVEEKTKKRILLESIV